MCSGELLRDVLTTRNADLPVLIKLQRYKERSDIMSGFYHTVEVTADVAFTAHIDFTEYDRKMWPISINQSEEVTTTIFCLLTRKNRKPSTLSKLRSTLREAGESVLISLCLMMITDCFMVTTNDYVSIQRV
jgi:hypothetical protein